MSTKDQQEKEQLKGNDPALAARGLKIERKRPMSSEQEGGADLDPDITRDDERDFGSTTIPRASGE